jgi:sortase A
VSLGFETIYNILMQIQPRIIKIIILVTSILLTAISGFNLYNAFSPEINFALTPFEQRENIDTFNKPGDEATLGIVTTSTITPNTLSPSELTKAPTPLPKDNRIVIPKIGVDAPITEGTSTSALDQGMWRRPNSSTPDKGGNTVITGHRVLRTKGPITFYFLNKVALNDEVYIYWKGKEYVYKVFAIKVVNPDQVDIENETKDSIITLYTCTPAWTSKFRLVVKAKLI